MSVDPLEAPKSFTAAEVKDVVRTLRATGKFMPDELAAMELLCSVLRRAAASPEEHLEAVVQTYLKTISKG